MIDAVEGGLVEAFRERIAPELWPAIADLEAWLRDAHRRGREAWPEVELDARTFAGHLASKLLPGVGLDALAIDDLYLACALGRGDAAAIRVLERDVLPQLAAVLARRGVAGDGIEEIAQNLREHLLVGTRERPGRIADYGGRGGLRSFMIVAAVRMSHRAGERARRLGAVPWTSIADLALAEPEEALARDEYRQPFERACEDALLELPRRERALLRLQLVDGASIDQIGRIYGVHRATAARWLARAKEMIRERTRDRLADALGVDASRAESIAELVHSRVDVSVARLLKTSSS